MLKYNRVDVGAVLDQLCRDRSRWIAAGGELEAQDLPAKPTGSPADRESLYRGIETVVPEPEAERPHQWFRAFMRARRAGCRISTAKSIAAVGIIPDELAEELLKAIENDGWQAVPIQEEFDFGEGVVAKPKPIVCECGSDKIKSPTHSSWCPKHVDKK